MSDTSACLRDALLERDIMRQRVAELQRLSNRDEEARRALARELRDARLTIAAQERALGEAKDGLASYLREAREFSRSTFGEGYRTLGVTRHIEKEIAEVRANPLDLSEWVDIILLACDGYWRHGGEPENLLADMLAKFAVNKKREWPKPASEDDPVEHDRALDRVAVSTGVHQ
jgi:serine/threonine protein phosphatase PrpC